MAAINTYCLTVLEARCLKSRLVHMSLQSPASYPHVTSHHVCVSSLLLKTPTTLDLGSNLLQYDLILTGCISKTFISKQAHIHMRQAQSLNISFQRTPTHRNVLTGLIIYRNYILWVYLQGKPTSVAPPNTSPTVSCISPHAFSQGQI